MDHGTDMATAVLNVLNYPTPDRGTGYCFRSISLFISLFLCQQSARLRENRWTDLHEIFSEGDHWTT